MAAFAAFDARQPPPDYTCFPGVCPAWDNSARRPRGKAIIFRNSAPKVFADWLAKKVHRARSRTGANLLFINAWNEWAEGCHLEPCQRDGHAWLDAMRAGIEDTLLAVPEQDAISP